MIEILIVEDHLSFLSALELMINQMPEMKVVAKANDGHEMILYLSRMKNIPQVAIVDINMPKINGVVFTQFLRYKYSTIKVIGISYHHQLKSFTPIIEAGAVGFLSKNNLSNLDDAINMVMQNELYIDPSLTDEWEGYIKHNPITPNQNRHKLSISELIFALLTTTELSYVEIAELMNQSVNTIKKHQKAICEKTGQSTRLNIAMYAIREDIAKVFRV